MSRPWPLRVIYRGDDRPIPAALGAIDELAALGWYVVHRFGDQLPHRLIGQHWLRALKAS
jgi:hypothetical protein